jgi:hypothetical protein
MIQHDNTQFEKQNKSPIRKAHYVGTSVVLTIDPIHVKRLSIDELTFFVQKPVKNGIMLEMRKLDANVDNQIEGGKATAEKENSDAAPVQGLGP